MFYDMDIGAANLVWDFGEKNFSLFFKIEKIWISGLDMPMIYRLLASITSFSC